jgi:hypothetical protein
MTPWPRRKNGLGADDRSLRVLPDTADALLLLLLSADVDMATSLEAVTVALMLCGLAATLLVSPAACRTGTATTSAALLLPRIVGI